MSAKRRVIVDTSSDESDKDERGDASEDEMDERTTLYAVFRLFPARHPSELYDVKLPKGWKSGAPQPSGIAALPWAVRFCGDKLHSELIDTRLHEWMDRQIRSGVRIVDEYRIRATLLASDPREAREEARAVDDADCGYYSDNDSTEEWRRDMADDDDFVLCD